MAHDETTNQEKINRVLRYAASYALSNPIVPPDVLASDLLRDGEGSIESPEILWYLSRNDTPHSELISALSKDPYSIPNSVNREGYAPGRDLAYWASGYAEYKMIETLAAGYGVKAGRYFDFGGSTGRLFRHFLCQSENWEVWSCDFKITSVDYILRYFPKRVRAFLNTAYPSLPIPDSYYDLVTACSVFTHLSETETSWLLELRRTMKVGGIAYITVLNEESWRIDDAIKASAKQFRPDMSPDHELPSGKSVIMFRDDDPYYCNVLHSNDYIYEVWGRYFEICEIRSPHILHQATVICRRTD